MLVNILERTTHNAACWVSVNIKQFTLCLVDILGLCTNISKLTLGIVSHRCRDSVLYLCLSCVYCTTHGSIPPARTHFPDFPLTTFKFHDFSVTTFKLPDFSVFSQVFQVGGHPAFIKSTVNDDEDDDVYHRRLALPRPAAAAGSTDWRLPPDLDVSDDELTTLDSRYLTTSMLSK